MVRHNPYRGYGSRKKGMEGERGELEERGDRGGIRRDRWRWEEIEGELEGTGGGGRREEGIGGREEEIEGWEERLGV